jgi:hypothetical protein
MAPVLTQLFTPPSTDFERPAPYRHDVSVLLLTVGVLGLPAIRGLLAKERRTRCA